MSNKYENVYTHLGPNSTHQASPTCLDEAKVGPGSPRKPRVKGLDISGIWGGMSLNKQVLVLFRMGTQEIPSK